MRRAQGKHLRNLLKPPLPYLLHNNSRISDEEYGIIVDVISRVQDEIDQLTELEKRDGASDGTYRDILACKEFIAKHRTLIHWTRRLPSELLVDIFITYTQDNMCIPWNLSQVCQRWRSLALQTPQLWQKVPFPKVVDLASETRRLNFLEDDYLKRSKNETLVFSWHPSTRTSTKLLKLMSRHSERWGNVQLIMEQVPDSFITRSLKCLTDHLGSLYALKIIIVGPYGFPLVPFDLSCFKTAPKLKTLELIDYRDEHYSDLLPTSWPWNQVTHLSAWCQYSSSIQFGSFAAFQNLTYVKLDWSHCHIVTTPFPDTIFPACRFLHLRTDRKLEGNTFTHIHFPVLEGLFIDCNPRYQQGTLMEDLVEFIEVNGTGRLKSLNWRYEYDTGHFYHDPFYRRGIPRLFHNLQHIHVLKFLLLKMEVAEYVMKQLSGKQDFMPNLRKLDLEISSLLEIRSERWNEPYVGRLVHLIQTVVTSSSCRLRDISLQFPEEPHFGISISSPWEKVMKLDNLDSKLQLDWEENKKNFGDSRVMASFRIASDATTTSSMTSAGIMALALQAAGLRRVLIDFLHSETLDPSSVSRLSRNKKEGIIQRWLMLFLDLTNERRWTIAATNKIIFVHPQSPLRKCPSRWVFGIDDYNDHDPGYIDDKWIPGSDPLWKSCSQDPRRTYFETSMGIIPGPDFNLP